MPAATAPVRVPAQRRARTSVSSASGHAHSPGEIAHLTLAEVRDRLARNERVLNSALFSTSPTARRPSFPNGPNPNAIAEEDPVRARLLAVRAQLCAREAELLADGVAGLGLESTPSVATSPPTRSAKANALAAIRLGEANQTSHVALPIDSTLALGERDFDQQWAARFASASLDSPSSSRAPSGRGHARGPGDALERSQAAARRARARIDDDDTMFDTDESYAAAGVYASQRGDMGNGLPLGTARARRAEGYDDDMRDEEDGDGDGGEWPEGNDEYDEIEGGHPEYGVAPETEGMGVRV